MHVIRNITIHCKGLPGIVRNWAGITTEGRVNSIKSAFRLFFTNEMLYIIILETRRVPQRFIRGMQRILNYRNHGGFWIRRN